MTLRSLTPFLNDLRTLNLNTDNVFMASFDIFSLFTNVPLDETIEIIIQKLFHKSTHYLGFSHVQLRSLLCFAVKNCHFLFNGCLYEQIDGVAMGSPLGPLFANIFLSHHEKNCLDNCPTPFKPLYFHRYVDDCFIIFRSQEHVEPFLDYLNHKHKNINFSCESNYTLLCCVATSLRIKLNYCFSH